MFKPYARKNIMYLRPYIEGETLDPCVSISEADKNNGSPRVGDMIGRNPNDSTDQWLVAEKYFLENYTPVE